MWTARHRMHHEARLKHVVSRCATPEVAAWPGRADPLNGVGATPTLPVAQAIAWHPRVSGGWRALPLDMPPWRRVYSRFRRWQGPGLFARMRRDLARLRRGTMGRKLNTRMVIIDTQTVKCIPVRGPRRLDAVKWTQERKRVVLVDADGVWLAIAVVPASVQERGLLPAPGNGRAARSGLHVAILDGAFTAGRRREWSNRHGMCHAIVPRELGWEGFAMLRRHWAVGRRAPAGSPNRTAYSVIAPGAWIWQKHASPVRPSSPPPGPSSTQPDHARGASR